MSLQELTTKVTAFSTWNQFAAAMDGGYTPTLRPQAGRSKAVKAHNAATQELAFKLESLGWKVWRGSR
jgi:hypothetical protein